MDESFSSKYKLLGTVLNINVIKIFIKHSEWNFVNICAISIPK